MLRHWRARKAQVETEMKVGVSIVLAGDHRIMRQGLHENDVAATNVVAAGGER